MGLFDLFKKSGGRTYAIRCDEKDFLIWKWKPASSDANAIRIGSSLSVRPGQAAIFLFPNGNEDYAVIKGPFNGEINPQSMPALSSLGCHTNSFMAEVYYVNLAKNMEIPFIIPFFRVVPAEKEYKAYDVEVAVKGTFVFEVSSQKEFVKYLFEAWGGNEITLSEFEKKLKSLLTQEVKQIVTNLPKDTSVFVLHFNSLIGEIGPYILARIQDKIASRFGILANDVTISEIRFDDELQGYKNLVRISEQQAHLFNLEKEKQTLLEMEIQRENTRFDAALRRKNAEKMAELQFERQKDMVSRMRGSETFPSHK